MGNKSKLLIGAILAFIVIIGSIVLALSILKEETVNNYIAISKLKAKTLSKEINQDLLSIEQVISNIAPILSFKKIEIDKQLTNILRNYPQIRSINIVDKNRIIHSTNFHNIGIVINEDYFYPKSFFDENILKFSTPWIGRDFIEGNNVYINDERITEKDSFFIPILKKVETKNGSFNIVINLNNEYFENRFLSSIESRDVNFELIRLDGILLLSSQNFSKIGKKVNEIKLLEKAIDKSIYTNVEMIDNRKAIVTYILTKNYPICLAIKLDYEKNLNSWNKKEYDFFIITTFAVIISIITSLIFFYRSNKHKEEELQSKEKFRLLFQDSHYLAAVINSDGEVLEMNNIALEFLGCSSDDVKNKIFWDLKCFIEKDRELIKNRVLYFDDEKYSAELVVLDKTGFERYISFTLSSMYIEDKRIYVAIGFDITERIEREKILKQAYVVFENTRDGIMITDKDAQIMDVNKSFEKITGYKKDEVIGKKSSILKSTLHSKQFYQNMWDKILSEGYWEGEITNSHKHGKHFTEWLSIDTIYDSDKNIINFIGVFSDITEQKRKEKLLKEKDRTLYQQSKLAAMGEMIGNIAHQWRQPLSLISTSATGLIIQKDLDLTNDKEYEIKILKSINNSAQYLSQTIEDFRNFLNVDKEIVRFSTTDTINDALSLSSMNLNSSDVKVVLDLNKDIYIDGIKNEFIQVLMNILKNAKDAYFNLDNEKLIFIKSYLEENKIFIEIKDNAGGIPENILDRIFEPYFTTKHKSQGTGIGLYMCEEIIKNHMKGNISVSNESFEVNNKIYKGACFKIVFPLV